MNNVFNKPRHLRLSIDAPRPGADFLHSMTVTSPDVTLRKLSILSAEERHIVLYEWNATDAEYPSEKCIHELFETQVATTPEAIALVYEGGQLTYAELNALANRLARHLQGLGVGPDKLVGLCVKRGANMIIGILGILKAGGAYVPLDPAYPRDRLVFMLEDSAPMALLTETGLDTLFEHRSATLPTVRLDAHTSLWGGQSDANLPCRETGLTSRHLAYVIYTSGSTGQPKGVMIEHQGLSNLVTAHLQSFDIKQGHRVLQFGSLSFDACMFETSMTLCRGASLYLARPEVALVGDTLIQTVERYGITHVGLPPAVLAALPEQTRFNSVETLLSAGEALSGALVRRWTSNHRFINGYGPTETTICATLYECHSEETKSPPIGRPIANKRIYILDSHGEPVPIGATGELYIGGVGVARGYLNRPELTAERFLPDPFTDEPNTRMYRTGDLGRWLADGNIEFIGRNDFQVKIRGLRIELGEIEAVLAQHPAVHEAVVMAREDIPENKQLVAYFLVAQDAAATRPSELWDFLRSRLPDFMIPSVFVPLHALPLTPNGKLDRKALPPPKAENASNKYSAPRNETEQKLVGIWKNLLGVENIGIQDNFFALGGNSLLSVNVVTEVRNHFNTDLPFTAMFQYPTIEELAKTIMSGGKQPSWYSLVPVQVQGSRPPLFSIHTITLQDLPRHLGKDQPLYFLRYGMSAENSNNPVRLPLLEDLASHYIKEMQLVQPNGPYYLIGFSFGGLIAYEMAYQLVKSGHQVKLVGLLDTYLKINKKILPFHRIINKFIRKLINQPSDILNIKKINFINRNKYSDNFWPHIYTSTPDINCFNSYKPKIYNGRIALFQGFEWDSKFFSYDKPEHAWRKLVGDMLEIHQLPAFHSDMCKEPNAKILAKKIIFCMDKEINNA
jgi:amino acid adenylation domain-containing protein